MNSIELRQTFQLNPSPQAEWAAADFRVSNAIFSSRNWNAREKEKVRGTCGELFHFINFIFVAVLFSYRLLTVLSIPSATINNRQFSFSSLSLIYLPMPGGNSMQFLIQRQFQILFRTLLQSNRLVGSDEFKWCATFYTKRITPYAL